nr:thioesterase [Acidobacteriota bacterium]
GCRYRTPFRYDEEVVIRTSVANAASRGIRFAYDLCDAAGEVRASGFTSHVWVDRETRKPVRGDEEVVRALAPFGVGRRESPL